MWFQRIPRIQELFGHGNQRVVTIWCEKLPNTFWQDMGKILHNKIFWFVFQKKTPPISILKLELKIVTENLSRGGWETHLFHRKNKNIASICHTKEPPTLPQWLCYSFLSACYRQNWVCNTGSLDATNKLVGAPEFMRRSRTSWQYNRAVKSQEKQDYFMLFLF